MDEDTDVSLELTDDEHPDAEAAAEDTARLLIEVRDNLAKRTAQNGQESSGSGDDSSSTDGAFDSADCSMD